MSAAGMDSPPRTAGTFMVRALAGMNVPASYWSSCGRSRRRKDVVALPPIPGKGTKSASSHRLLEKGSALQQGTRYGHGRDTLALRVSQESVSTGILELATQARVLEAIERDGRYET